MHVALLGLTLGLPSLAVAQTQAPTYEQYIRQAPANPPGALPAATEPVRQALHDHVAEMLDAWPLAPLYVQPGIAGQQFFFDDSGGYLHALSIAYPFLEEPLRQRVADFLAEQWAQHPPWTEQRNYALDVGTRRELFIVPKDALWEIYPPDPPQALGELYAVWAYAEYVGQWEQIETARPELTACFRSFCESGWSLPEDKGDLYMNRYIAGLIGFARVARRLGLPEADEAAALASTYLEALRRHFEAGVDKIQLTEVPDVSHVDRFIGEGDTLFLRVRGHCAKIAKFADLTPEVGRFLREQAGAAAQQYLRYTDLVMPGWYLIGEERQVHYGENLFDPPDFSLGILQAKAYIEEAPFEQLIVWADRPWCVGDLTYVERLVLCLRAAEGQ